MKNTRLLLSWIFTVALLATFTVGLAQLVSTAQAGVIDLGHAGAGILAQIDAPGAAPAATADVPWFLTGEVIGTAIALIGAVFGIWRNSKASTATKISQTLVEGIEAASKIPAVSDHEKAIKAKIRRVAEENGVQPLLARIVKDLT